MGARSVAVFLWSVALGIVLLAGLVSWKEREEKAVERILLLAVALALVILSLVWLPGWGGSLIAWGSIVAFGCGAALFYPFPGRDLPELGAPRPGVDERDIMFSRAVLEPGTERFEGYYEANPEFRTKDDLFRLEPGLLAPGSTHYHPEGFAAADAAFWTIEMLRPFVDGGQSDGRRAGLVEGHEGAPESEAHPREFDPLGMTRFLKAWTVKLGAHSVGVTPLKDYHCYSHVGRGDGYGEKVLLDHPFALALTVEMDKEMVDSAPRSPTAMESARQYLRSGTMAIQLADLIRRLGYQARAHVDGNYRIICPLVAKDAGLGELGRMGLLMTPTLGPRVRIAVVTTDIPLVADEPFRDPTTVDFCLQCRKCAESCPSQALPFGDPEEDGDGVLRWKVDPEACFTLWTKLGTDCARCMAVCPYSHPDNLLHNAVRWGIRRNVFFRSGAVWMDDLVYGRRPPPKGLPSWMEGIEAPEPGSRKGRGGDP